VVRLYHNLVTRFSTGALLRYVHVEWGYGSLLINSTLSTMLSVNDLADVLGGELVLHRICGLTNNRAAPRKLNAFRAVFSNYRTCPAFGGHYTRGIEEQPDEQFNGRHFPSTRQAELRTPRDNVCVPESSYVLIGTAQPLKESSTPEDG
jgi:hypothetical protein